MKYGMVLSIAALSAIPVLANQQEAEQLYQQAQTAYQAGNFGPAAEQFERSDTVFPRLEAAYDASVCYLWMGQCDAARRAIQRLIDRTPELRDNAGVAQAESALRGQQQTSEGGRCALVNRLVRSVDRALGVEVEDNVSEEDARAFSDQARRSYEAGDYLLAARLYESAHATYPTLVDALLNAGMAYHLAGRQLDAIGAFRRVVEQSPANVRTNAAVAQAMSDASGAGGLGGVEQCVLASRLRRSITIALGDRASEEGSARRLFQRGLDYFRAQDYRGAVPFFECSTSIVLNQSSLFNLGICYIRLHDWDNANTAYNRYFQRRDDIAADPVVQQVRQEIEANPYIDDQHGEELYERLDWAIRRAQERLEAPEGDTQ